MKLDNVNIFYLITNIIDKIKVIITDYAVMVTSEANNQKKKKKLIKFFLWLTSLVTITA